MQLTKNLPCLLDSKPDGFDESDWVERTHLQMIVNNVAGEMCVCVTCPRYAALKQVCSLGLKPVQELHSRLLCRVKRKEWDLFWTWAR